MTQTQCNFCFSIMYGRQFQVNGWSVQFAANTCGPQGRNEKRLGHTCKTFIVICHPLEKYKQHPQVLSNKDRWPKLHGLRHKTIWPTYSTDQCGCGIDLHSLETKAVRSFILHRLFGSLQEAIDVDALAGSVNLRRNVRRLGEAFDCVPSINLHQSKNAHINCLPTMKRNDVLSRGEMVAYWREHVLSCEETLCVAASFYLLSVSVTHQTSCDQLCGSPANQKRTKSTQRKRHERSNSKETQVSLNAPCSRTFTDRADVPKILHQPLDSILLHRGACFFERLTTRFLSSNSTPELSHLCRQW